MLGKPVRAHSWYTYMHCIYLLFASANSRRLLHVKLELDVQLIDVQLCLNISYINWPFVPDVVNFMEDYTKQAHALNIQVKF